MFHIQHVLLQNGVHDCCSINNGLPRFRVCFHYLIVYFYILMLLCLPVFPSFLPFFLSLLFFVSFFISLFLSFFFSSFPFFLSLLSFLYFFSFLVMQSQCKDVSSNPSGIILCKKCKAMPAAGLTCIKCNSLNHPSCAKLLRNVKFLSETTIICCDNADDAKTLPNYVINLNFP